MLVLFSLFFRCITQVDYFIEPYDESMKKRNLFSLNSNRGNTWGRRSSQKQAMEAWASSLTNDDYNETVWDIRSNGGQPPQWFDSYLMLLSDIFAEKRAYLNFISIGACDGTNDLTIKRFLKQTHWHGMFVEPVSINYEALVQYLKKADVMHRSFPLRAAATDKCKEPIIKVQRPLYEEQKGEKVSHFYFIANKLSSIPVFLHKLLTFV